MEDFWKEYDVPEKHPSDEAVKKWQHALYLVKNYRRRYRYVATINKRSITEERLSSIRESLRLSFLANRAKLLITDNPQRYTRKERYTREEILSATFNFSHENLMTEGALGRVYKGQLLYHDALMNYHDAFMNLVIQRLDCKYGQRDVLQMEISKLQRIKHDNIVSVFGYCDEKDVKVIVYEAFNGTLNQHLSDPNLTWSQRLQICLGVAHALNHIHYDVIHCDINSSKVILDEDWEPKIYGFELSTEYPQSWMHRLRFSRYFNSNILTPKYDVYLFGLLLLEVLYGRKPNITNGVIQEELDIDPDLRKQMDTESLTDFTNIAYKCLNQQPAQRPTMDQIVKEHKEVLELQWKHPDLEHPIAAAKATSPDSLEIPLSKIRRATNGFDKAYWIGTGGYAEVYKAELDFVNIQGKSKDEVTMVTKTVAIKRIISRADEQGKQGFFTEIDLLKCCKHQNIISLLGFSREANEMVLVYEYAFKGSLSDYLVSSDRTTVNLTWAQRMHICLDIAHGINYLHNNMEGKQRIIHRDIKSDNILLDENMTAKLADFGLSRSHPTSQQPSSVYTENIAGTKFYVDPEYSIAGKYKRESDIYSFGVVLFEVLSGRMAYDSVYTNENDMGLAPIARRRYNEGTIKELIDPKMIEEDSDHSFTLNKGPNQDSFNTFSKIANQCLAETQAKRPTIEVVMKELQNALELQGETMVLSRFQYKDIKLATNNFAERYCIGLDTKGKVYKAKLKHSLLATDKKISSEPYIIVAIKRFTGSQGQEVFFADLERGTNYKHPNITSVLGFCDEGDEMIIVYEYASGISLDDFLKIVDKIDTFTWTHRLRMCLEIAHGLNHLHTMLNRHGDIRSANILLDKNWKVKIAYFGISKLHSTNQEIGTKVYDDPEYEKTSKLIRESDIYSLGVVLFEIFCGRLAYDSVYIKENFKGLAPIARQCFNDRTIEKIIDPRLKEETSEDIFASNRGPNQESLDIFSKIADKCLGKAVERPSMETVIMELQKALDFQETFLEKLQISLRDIESATENFSEKNFIGSGRFWKAYKGELPFTQDKASTSGCTTIVAKRWDSKFGQGDHQFRMEVNILFKTNHENIIGLVGYCQESNEKIIVHEHMSNGSLDRYLEDANLTWMKRLQICIDVASGLEFLHQDRLKKVVHRDIKSSSILLNDEWKAKISNLELSTLGSLNQDMEHVRNNAYATLGYLDPQYKQGFLTEKSDIYSFGVVLFEILCGRLAWAEDCKYQSQSLGPLAKRCYENQTLDKIVFDGMKEQIGPESLVTFTDIAYQCLHDRSEDRPTAREVVLQLKKALNVQKDYEIWEAQLHEDYKEIFQASKTPEIYSRAKRKDLYDILFKGILIQEGKVWFSVGSNAERNEMVSASQFSYQNSLSHKWRSVPESRFDKIAEMLDISHLNIQIKIRSQFLSSNVKYGVHLVFKFCGARKSTAKRMYVNLTYKMGNETFHSYFATWREDEWMTVELYRFLNHKESDTSDFEFLLESFSRCYCGNHAIYVEGIEFRAIDNVKREENNIMEAQQVLQSTSHMDPMPILTTNNFPFDLCSVFTQTLLKLFSRRNKEKQHYMLSAHEAFCDSFNTKRFNLKPSSESRFQKVVELLSTHVFRIKCKIESKMLLQNTKYSCYLVFKLSRKRCGLHCPVIVRDLHQRKNKQKEVVYFRSPKPWNINDVNRVPQEREDGWMEVCVWKFESNHVLQNKCLSMNLKFVTYEGTMYGLIICGFEFRPM